MRAKRSKKYRKLMHQYELTFGFREPYQVLVDSNFLRSVHSFKMDLVAYLERTLQGKAKPYITKCSLAAVMASSPAHTRPHPNARPPHLPPPTVLPLRYCSHNEESTPIDEAECLLSLLSPSPEAKKNKEHYILATADPENPTAENAQKHHQKQKSAPVRRYNLRRDARLIPGVPIIYVKRSVMVLEPMSGASEGVRQGFERGKFKSGFVSTNVTGKRKRDDADGTGAPSGGEKKAKKAKGPNPLSVKKPKKKEKQNPDDQGKAQRVESTSEGKSGGNQGERIETGEPESTGKTKRKRRHKSNKTEGAGPDAATVVES